MQAKSEQGPRQGAQAIRRALKVLRILAEGREIGLPVSEVVRATELARPTVHRIINALMEEGIVERHDKSGRYSVGKEVAELALARSSPSPLLAAASDILKQTSLTVGDTLFLAVRTGNDMLCVDRKIGSYPVQVLSIEVGARGPLGISSAGIAVLAGMPPHRARRIVLFNETRFATYGTDASKVLAQVADARRKGYHVRENGLVWGTKAISTCIRAPGGDAVAAITVTAVRTRLGARREREVAELLLGSADAIGRRIQNSSG